MDTPEHGNIGDQAIALAEQQLLDEWFGPDSYFEVTANQVEGFEKTLAKLSPMNQVILVHGGGFLGSLWPNEEYRFRRILEAFRGHRVVVFPQTVTFDRSTPEGEEFFQESVTSWCSHPDLTICCRERLSERFVSENFPGVRALLTPDVVLGLETPSEHVERHGVLFCMRADRERVLDDVTVKSLSAAVKAALPGEPIAYTDTAVDHRVPPKRREREVFAKLAEFSSARLMVTDRLHGMVFAAITGTPCVALNNSNGKVGRVYEWIAELSYVRFFQNVDEAVEAIRDSVPKPGVFPLHKHRGKLGDIRSLIAEAARGSV
ncbi:polysaccharide pyruvyl transferase family protein [Thermophilibacter sp.]